MSKETAKVLYNMASAKTNTKWIGQAHQNCCQELITKTDLTESSEFRSRNVFFQGNLRHFMNSTSDRVIKTSSIRKIASLTEYPLKSINNLPEGSCMAKHASWLSLSRRLVLVAIFIITLFAANNVYPQNISGELQPNDDGSSSLIPLGFTFKFYGTEYNALYVNNNGNVTFNGPLSTFTPFAFPSGSGKPMIAPFFADVDTRNGKGRVHYTGNEDYFKVVWENVGYYDATSEDNLDYRNTFSLTIQKNNGIIFQYDAMVWTTGDASDGEQGYGGSPATLGVDRGNGADAVAFRRYSDSRVSELNGTTWYFQTDKAELDVPLFKQGNGFPGYWGGELTLNSPSNTMRNTGCFVTSTAMLLRSVGHNTEPGKLNLFLRNSPAPYNMSGGNLSFSQINSDTLFFGQTDEVPGPKLRFRSDTVNDGTRAPAPLPLPGDVNLKNEIVSQIAAAIEANGPVILRVPSRNWGTNGYGTTHTHAIVAYAAGGGDVQIREPGWNNSPDSLSAYVTFVNNYVRDVKEHPEWQLTNSDGQIGGNDFSWLIGSAFTYSDTLTPFKKQIIQGEVNSPVDIVITDSLGRRLGRNPITGVSYDEIPDSVYFHEQQAAPADDDAQTLTPVEHMPLVFEIGDYREGNYKFEVFGTGDGPWSINFGVSDPVMKFNPEQYKYSGVANLGSYQSFNVPVSLQGNQANTTSPTVIVSPNLQILSPADQEMKEVQIQIRTKDDSTTPETLRLDSVYLSSNEPDKGVANRDRAGDCNGQDGFVQPVNVTQLFGNSSRGANGERIFVGKVRLRAEFATRGQGRIYTIRVTVSDQDGNVGIGEAKVSVLN